MKPDKKIGKHKKLCWSCETHSKQSSEKHLSSVCDHCHPTGNVRGLAHNSNSNTREKYVFLYQHFPIYFLDLIVIQFLKNYSAWPLEKISWKQSRRNFSKINRDFYIFRKM